MPISLSNLIIKALSMAISGGYALLAAAISIALFFISGTGNLSSSILTVSLYTLIGAYTLALVFMNITSTYPTGRSPLVLQAYPYTIVFSCMIQEWLYMALFIMLMAYPRFIALAALIEGRNHHSGRQ